MSYNGWMVPDTQRALVLAQFPPRFAVVKATHVTLEFETKEIPADASIEIVGYATDDVGVEALICRVDGETERPDGLIFHLTLSVAEDRASKESNEVIATHGWKPLPEPMAIRTRAFMSSGVQYITTPLSGL